jgi:4,5-dihydroxyphthalate decarboxylase
MMADLHLSFAMTPYDRIVPLITGEVKPAGITLDYQGMPGAVPGVFYDQIKFQRYDLSEMSFSSSLVERAKGWPYRLLPVFHNRQFFYTTIVIRRSSGIRVDHPEDLRGKRFAVGDYQQSAALWIRGVLQHEYGVTPQDMEWVQTRGQNYSHTGASGTKPPVKLSYATKPASTLFLNGEIDAAMSWLGIGADNALERRGEDIRGNPDFTLLFDDPRAEAIRYFKKTGIYPPQHTTAVRESILHEHPWVAMSLLNAFEEAKQIAIRRMRDQTLLVFTAQYIDEVTRIFGPDPFAYGIKRNAAAIDFVQTISVEQSLTPRKQPLDQIFPAELLVAEERLSD